MKILLAIFLLSVLTNVYLMYTAPTMDEKTGRIIEPGKRLRDLFRRKKNIDKI